MNWKYTHNCDLECIGNTLIMGYNQRRTNFIAEPLNSSLLACFRSL